MASFRIAIFHPEVWRGNAIADRGFDHLRILYNGLSTAFKIYLPVFFLTKVQLQYNYKLVFY